MLCVLDPSVRPSERSGVERKEKKKVRFQKKLTRKKINEKNKENRCNTNGRVCALAVP